VKAMDQIAEKGGGSTIDAWRGFAARVLTQAGLPAEPAEAVARGLVEGDAYGHSTHGLTLLADYVEELDAGKMTASGRPEVLADAGAAATWDGRRLPGVWTTMLAVDDAVRRSTAHGIGAVALRRSHHIGCLAAYLETPARAGHVVIVFSSDPSDAHVAPYGATQPVLTPNPVAAGIPCAPDPILIDVSTSITTAGMCAKARGAGRRLSGKWLIDAEGVPTDDPFALKRGGSILPIGGLDHGHKGFGLSLLVEALTQGLAGYGRADKPGDWGAGVLVLALAPSRFAGTEAFLRQTTWTAAAAKAAPPIDAARPVRLPGQLALERKRKAEQDGLVLEPAIVASLAALGRRFGVLLPTSAAAPASPQSTP
jgi:LDH2 family malate/lactate/ureidoglycolate dehydrogenase